MRLLSLTVTLQAWVWLILVTSFPNLVCSDTSKAQEAGGGYSQSGTGTTPTTGQPASSSPTSETGTSDKSNSPKLVDLDTNNQKETNEYTFSKGSSDDIITFSAKRNCGFSKVFQKKSGWNCFGSDKVVWESNDKTKYGVYIRVVGTDSVSITLNDETKKEFELTGNCWSKSWNEQGSSKKSS